MSFSFHFENWTNLICVLIRPADGETERQTDRGRDSKTALINSPSGSACLFHPSGGKIPSDLTPIIPLFSLSTSFLSLSPVTLSFTTKPWIFFNLPHHFTEWMFPCLKNSVQFSLSAWTWKQTIICVLFNWAAGLWWVKQKFTSPNLSPNIYKFHFM